ncbi:MAG: 6-phosphofructokinase [Armatimonadetes bacterium]|nr:6-phosphofructokinase [Armatimonadota bacterium]MDE2205055.1 6-phosphofructokinase [Armatimonadota bacterium]
MKVGILTGGGDCPGLNPAIRGFVMRGLDFGLHVTGIRQGWRGLVQGIVDSEPLTVADVEPLIWQGGTALLSSRTNPYASPADLEATRANIRKYGFEALVALGGEDTLGVASRLFDEGINTVGVPKTMDNDLDKTDYTFGFDSALGVCVECIDRVRDTARSHRRVLVVEVMGRHAGFVALNAGIAGGADWILLPEETPDIGAMCRHLETVYARKGYAIVVASEGAVLAGADAGAGGGLDSFGHQSLSAVEVGRTVAAEIERRTEIETRHVVLGHIQRGGAPSAFDRVLATRLGIHAAECVHEGDFGKMVALRGNAIIRVELRDAVRARQVPTKLIAEARTLTNK